MIRYITPKSIEITDNFLESKICIDFENQSGHIERVELKYEDFVEFAKRSYDVADLMNELDDIGEKIECH